MLFRWLQENEKFLWLTVMCFYQTRWSRPQWVWILNFSGPSRLTIRWVKEPRSNSTCPTSNHSMSVRLETGFRPPILAYTGGFVPGPASPGNISGWQSPGPRLRATESATLWVGLPGDGDSCTRALSETPGHRYWFYLAIGNHPLPPLLLLTETQRSLGW